MQIDPAPQQPRPATDEDRQAAADLLQHACGDGRLTLDEFSDRVGAVWAAERTDEIVAATDGLAAPPVVGGTRSVRRIVNVIGEHNLRGRWRLRERLDVWSGLGEINLDLRDAVLAEMPADNTVSVTVWSLIGEVNVTVPEGIEVEVSGFVLIGERNISLEPVPRRPGTPLVRLRVHGLIGEVNVRSRKPRRRRVDSRRADRDRDELER